MDPGGTNTWTFEVTNSADNPYTIVYTCIDTAEKSTITSFKINNYQYITDLKDGDDMVNFNDSVSLPIGANDGDLDEPEFDVHVVEVVITTYSDAEPGPVTVGFDVARS